MSTFKKIFLEGRKSGGGGGHLQEGGGRANTGSLNRGGDFQEGGGPPLADDMWTPMIIKQTIAVAITKVSNIVFVRILR